MYQEPAPAPLSVMQPKAAGSGATRARTPEGLPPGPRGPAALNTFRLATAPYEQMDRWVKRFGTTFTLRLLGFGTTLWISDRAAIQQLFTDSENLLAGKANAYALEPIMGWESILLSDGAAHIRHRRLLLPRFHGDLTERYGRMFAETAQREVESWKPGERFALYPRLRRLSAESILRAVFGAEGQQRDRLRERTMRYVDAAGVTVFGPWIRHDLGRHSPWGRFLHARQQFEESLRSLLARGLSDPACAGGGIHSSGGGAHDHRDVAGRAAGRARASLPRA
jgi:cytochrome P450